MISIRLGEYMEHELSIISKVNHKTKTDVIKEALTYYFKKLEIEEKKTSYDLGKDLFAVSDKADESLSQNYKLMYKKNLDAKYNY